jgi:hypothetical protein
MASGQQTYSGAGLSIGGLIEQLSREAARLDRRAGVALNSADGQVASRTASISPFANRPIHAQPGGVLQSSARVSRFPGAASALPEPQGFRYGQLYAPPIDDLTELRRQQADFARTRREIAWRNSWLAVPALAPVAAPYLVGGVRRRSLAGRYKPMCPKGR